MNSNNDNSKLMKATIAILAALVVLISVAFAFYIKKGSGDSSSTGNTSSTNTSKFKSLSELSSPSDNAEKTEVKTTGNDKTRRIMATRLNMRTEPGLNNEPIGTISLNSIVELISTQDDWALVDIKVEGLTAAEENGEMVFSDSEGHKKLYVKKDLVNDNGQVEGGNQYYVHRSYLTDESEKYEIIDTSNAAKPFIYGLTFYNEETAKLIETEIWKGMRDKLEEKGYDGVKVVPYKRDNFFEMVDNKEVDAIECASGDLASINDNNKKLEVFAKNINKITGESSYAGVIIANKNSGISTAQDIIGKTIAACKPNSDSGNQFQRYYLKEVEGIDISSNDIDETNYHPDVLIKVATNKAEVGFCGDFVLTDNHTKFKKSAAVLDVPMENEEDLKRLKDNIVYFELEGINKIPNNPHAVRIGLASDQSFVESLKSIIDKCYNDHRDDFGLTDANSEEYDFLNQIK